MMEITVADMHNVQSVYCAGKLNYPKLIKLDKSGNLVSCTVTVLLWNFYICSTVSFMLMLYNLLTNICHFVLFVMIDNLLSFCSERCIIIYWLRQSTKIAEFFFFVTACFNRIDIIFK